MSRILFSLRWLGARGQQLDLITNGLREVPGMAAVGGCEAPSRRRAWKGPTRSEAKGHAQGIILMGIMLCGLSFSAWSQERPAFRSDSLMAAWPLDSVEVDDAVGAFPKQALAALKQLSISGYYRFVTNYRHLDQSYKHLEATPNNLFVGDDSQIPQLMLNINGSVLKNTSFGTDLYLWTPMTGTGASENVKGLNLGVSLYGTYNSSVGSFTVRAGGINWYSLSPFTFQTNKGYNRYSVFERNPWDPNTATMGARYETFYKSGGINQDQRWGQQAFQGVIVEAKSLPLGFSGSMMYGKTQLNGGLSPLPNNSFGGMIKKEYGDHFISFNTFNNLSFTDSTQKQTVGFNVATLEFKNKFKNLLIKGEVGLGRAFDQRLSGNWGEAISLKFSTDVAGKSPLELHVYRVSPNVINNSAIFINTSIEQAVISNNNTATQPVLPAVASAMVPIGQMTNNRQGFDLNSQIDIGKLKLALGYSNSMELDGLSSKLTYGHPINNLVLAHFWRWDFPSNVGPYNNLSKVYRAVYETLVLTAIDPVTGTTAAKKYFNTLEVNAKYKTRIFKRDLHLFYLGQFNSAQNYLSPATVFTEKAYLRTYYHQFEAYYALTPSVIWCSYLGYERIVANYATQTDLVSRRPKNQTGLSIGTGFDIRLSKGAGLYLRQRWVDYKDTSFDKDRYNGFETTAEIKIFF